MVLSSVVMGTSGRWPCVSTYVCMRVAELKTDDSDRDEPKISAGRMLNDRRRLRQWFRIHPYCRPLLSPIIHSILSWIARVLLILPRFHRIILLFQYRRTAFAHFLGNFSPIFHCRRILFLSCRLTYVFSF